MRSYQRLAGRVIVVSASVGAGHDGAALELARRFAAAGATVSRHDYLDMLPLCLGRAALSAYRTALKRAPHMWDVLFDGMDHGTRLGRSAVRLARLAERRCHRMVRDNPSLVVSTYPLATQLLGEMRARGELTAPVVAYLTDVSVHPLCVHPGVDLYLAMHPITAHQARALGARRVIQTFPVVRPEFGRVDGDSVARARHGLPAGPLALVAGGSWGVGEVYLTARDIAATGLATPVVVCGSNDSLRERLTAERLGHPLGWVDDMSTLMRACDVVVQNAGGLTALEAVAGGVPVITYRSLAGHGRTNAAALHAAGWAEWVTDLEDLPRALSSALAAPRREIRFAGVEPAEAALDYRASRLRQGAAASTAIPSLQPRPQPHLAARPAVRRVARRPAAAAGAPALSERASARRQPRRMRAASARMSM